MRGHQQQDICPDCDKFICPHCDLGGECVECGRPMCVVCFHVSHKGEARGRCWECHDPDRVRIEIVTVQ